jgi:hypothetical protein
MLGYQGFVLNAVDVNNNNSCYTSNVAAGNYYQENTVMIIQDTAAN